jgi:uncharacterized protein (DUF1330 family)
MSNPVYVPAQQPVTVIALLTIAEDQPMALAEYLGATMPLLERVGARIVRRFCLTEMVVGAGAVQSVVMVEYPSREAVDQVFGSPEYAAIRRVRDRAFLTYQISIVADQGGGSTEKPEKSGEDQPFANRFAPV